MAGTRKVTRLPQARPDDRFAIVAAKFNDDIVRRLFQGAMKMLQSCGVPRAHILPVWVPGALEIPLAVQKIARSGSCRAVIALGAVIKGGTDHYQHVCEGASRGVMQVSLETGVPVANGILTVQTHAQARERAGGQVGNKGAEAALAAVEMSNLLRTLDRQLSPEISLPPRTKRSRTGE